MADSDTIDPNAATGSQVLSQGFWEFSRFYGSWRPGKYMFPIDEEETNRMDIFHKFFMVSRDDRLYTFSPPPTAQAPRIMDLGTGTGIWPINVAEDYLPNSHIMAIDLNQIQPSMIPRNVIIKQYDLEDAIWEGLLTDCHIIHMRMLLGSIQTDLWSQVYKNVLQHLVPLEGYFEQVELDWVPRWDGPDIPQNSALARWSDCFLRGLDNANRSARISSDERKRLLEDAGFVDVQEQVIRCNMSPWTAIPHENDKAQWLNLGFGLAMNALSFGPMIKQLGMRMDQVIELNNAATTESRQLRYHAYYHIHIWTARRPAS